MSETKHTQPLRAFRVPIRGYPCIVAVEKIGKSGIVLSLAKDEADVGSMRTVRINGRDAAKLAAAILELSGSRYGVISPATGNELCAPIAKATGGAQ